MLKKPNPLASSVRPASGPSMMRTIALGTSTIGVGSVSVTRPTSDTVISGPDGSDGRSRSGRRDAAVGDDEDPAHATTRLAPTIDSHTVRHERKRAARACRIQATSQTILSRHQSATLDGPHEPFLQELLRGAL